MPQGAAALKKMPGVKVVEEEKVPETDAVEKTMESHDQPRRRHAAVPDLVRLLRPAHAQDGGEISEAALPALRRPVERQGSRRTPAAISATSTRPSTSHGIVAGYTTKSGKLGFVAAKPIPQVLRNINAFTLGAKLVNPKATTQVIFTGDWSMPVKEAEATNSLIDQGVDVLTCHVDGPKVVVETAARRGAWSAAITPTRRRWRRRAISPAPSGTGKRSTRRSSKMITAGETHPELRIAAA